MELPFGWKEPTFCEKQAVTFGTYSKPDSLQKLGFGCVWLGQSQGVMYEVNPPVRASAELAALLCHIPCR